MATTTPQQGLPIPEITDDPNIVDDITQLALAIEKKLVGVYTNAADRDAKVTAPIEGQVALLKDVNQIHAYLDTAWVQIFPQGGIPAFTSGTEAPNNASGADGDVYFRI